ncbi:MAG TPA: MFS transporter, partial [Actinomycetota bacterium]|nr:MFS transporter [Actinomycetota bacterium]
IAGRAVMGAGAALIMPATLSTITVVFPPDERRRAIALWAGFAGAGGSFGPVVSGLLLERFWWGSTMLALLPVVALTAGTIALICPPSRDDDSTPLDPVGALLSLVALIALLFAIIEAPEKGLAHPEVLTAIAVGVVMLAAFVAWERRTPHPMLPFDLFGDLRFRMGSGVITMIFFIMFGWFFATTLYLQYVRDLSALQASLAMLPFPLAMILVAPRSARLAERFGSGRVITAGFGAVAGSFAVLSLLSADAPYVLFGLTFALMGSGMGITTAPATGNIMSAVPPGKAGVGSAVNDTTREFGGALGIATIGSLVSAIYRAGMDSLPRSIPAEAAEAARESVGAAISTGRALPGGELLVSQAIDSYSGAYRATNIAAAVLALVAALIVQRFFSQRKEAEANLVRPESMPELTGVSVRS